MSVSYGKGYKGKATKLHSKLVRSTGYCENCGTEDYSKLTAAHIIGRKYSATRTRLSNALCLCYSCHRYYTDNPREFRRFVTGTWAAELYDNNLDWTRRSVKYGDIYWQSEYERLKLIEQRLSNGEDYRDIRANEKHTLDV